MQRYICNRAAGVCKKKPPPLTKQRKHDEKFQAMSVRTARLWRKFGAQFSRRNSARSSARNSHGAILTTPTGGREADAGHAGEPEGDGDVWYHVPPRGPRGDDGQDEGHGAWPRRATLPRNSARNSRRNSLRALSPLQFPEGDPEMGMDGEEVVGEGGVATEAPDAGEIDYADDEKDEV